MSSISPPPVPPPLDALCCVCGTVRQVGARSRVAANGNRVLKCATCKGPTMHAIIGRHAVDWRELDNREHPAITCDGLEVVRAAGVLVFEVPDLDCDVIFEHPNDKGDPGRGFIRAELSGEMRREAALWLLGVALERPDAD